MPIRGITNGPFPTLSQLARTTNCNPTVRSVTLPLVGTSSFEAGKPKSDDPWEPMGENLNSSFDFLSLIKCMLLVTAINGSVPILLRC
jgi:hypothetical protein